MGGRGSSSASNRAGVGGMKPASRLTDRQLAAETSSVNGRMESVGKVMERTAPGHVGYLQRTPQGSKRDHESYTKAFKEYGELRARRDELTAEAARRRPKEKPRPKTFVNSYGEATTKYISTSTYERAERRLQKEVDSWFGVGRRRMK